MRDHALDQRAIGFLRWASDTFTQEICVFDERLGQLRRHATVELLAFSDSDSVAEFEKPVRPRGSLASANTYAAHRAKLRTGVHILRHTFCSHLVMRGAAMRAVQELVGHQDLTMPPAWRRGLCSAREKDPTC